MWIATSLFLLAAGIVLYFRRLAAATEPVFVIEADIEIEASAEEVWGVLSDFASYPDWNPYVLKLAGDVVPGGTIRFTIAQENWRKPMTLNNRVLVFDAPRELRWHGSPLLKGFLETDHYFQLSPAAPGRTWLHHAEEFRGWFARFLGEKKFRVHTRNAFRRMNEALAARVAERS